MFVWLVLLSIPPHTGAFTCLVPSPAADECTAKVYKIFFFAKFYPPKFSVRHFPAPLCCHFYGTYHALVTMECVEECVKIYGTALLKHQKNVECFCCFFSFHYLCATVNLSNTYIWKSSCLSPVDCAFSVNIPTGRVITAPWMRIYCRVWPSCRV